MALQCGIVGLPNVGKSTLFNCLSNAKAQAANFPFCTIEPNVGVITVPDERLVRTGGNRPPEARRADHDRDRRHRGPGQRGLEGRGAGQQVPGQHPQHQRHHPRAALLRQRQHHPCGRLGRPRARQRNHRHRVAAQRPRNRREPASAKTQKQATSGGDKNAKRTVELLLAIQGGTRTGPQSPAPSNWTRRTASWWPISTC